MSGAKLVWRVQEAPTGRYRSFSERGWPKASYGTADGPAAAMIRCEDEYVPSRVRTGDHAPLDVYVAHWSKTEEQRQRHGGFRWRKLKDRAATLQEAKDLAARAVELFPYLMPEEVAP